MILFAAASSHDMDSRYLSAEEQTRELTRSIRREVGKLSEQWNNLIDRSDNWKHRLDEYMTVSQMINKFAKFARTIGRIEHNYHSNVLQTFSTIFKHKWDLILIQ